VKCFKIGFWVVLLTATLFIVFSSVPNALARLEVSLEVDKVAEHSMLVTLTWTAVIDADRDWDNCELVIAFRDLRDRELHRVEEMVSIKKGVNKITGHDICKSALWEKTRKFTGNLNCGF
jgi:hypothetical protein